MIDVMLFLLATFMLTSLAMQNLNSMAVDLPRGNAAPMQARTPVTLTVTKDGGIFLNKTPVTLATLVDVLKPMLQGSEAGVIVAADSAAPNGLVVQAMLKTRDAGAEHFLIAVKHAD